MLGSDLDLQPGLGFGDLPDLVEILTCRFWVPTRTSRGCRPSAAVWGPEDRDLSKYQARVGC